ncbi:MAG: hypothetical protein KME17_13245 [Cyanosarcina radialis HA8281-LM2]|jgi:hypothetical protein|nr:hypothetical protein [Cyanosarcina radialis HA8281-LM2]
MNNQLWIDRLGEWNPQLLRELKGRLQPRNLWLAIVASLGVQFCLLLAGTEGFNAAPRWPEMFLVLNFLLPIVVLVGGVYLLIGDLAKEKSRGTLNFIRLSPTSSENILLGKMLGVPVLLYLAIALALPLHLISALNSGMPLNWILAVYTLWGAGLALFYSGALLSVLVSRSERATNTLAGSGTALAFILGMPYLQVVNRSYDLYKFNFTELQKWKWLLFPVGSQPIFLYAWFLVAIAVATYWILVAANRGFSHPTARLLSKEQSYWLVASLQIWLLGFAWPEVNPTNDSIKLIGFFFLFAFNPIWFIILTANLSPQRQSMQDWMRYRKTKSASQSFWQQQVVRDLIWGEKSPTIIAIAINLLITAAIWLPWIFLNHLDKFPTSKVLIGLLLTSNIILIYAGLLELISAIAAKKSLVWSASILGTIFVPLVLLIALSVSPEKYPIFWLFSVFPVIALPQASSITIFLALLSQWSVLGFVSLQLTKQLQRLGKSASSGLLAGVS